MMSQEKTLALHTRAVHAGELERRPGAPLNVPVYHSAMFVTADAELGHYDDITYLRGNNTPNQVQLGQKLADLEGGEAGLVTASGMAAITATLLTVLGRGGHLIAQSSLYGGTHSFITQDFPSFGLTHTFIDATRPDGWAKALRPETKPIYVE